QGTPLTSTSSENWPTRSRIEALSTSNLGKKPGGDVFISALSAISNFSGYKQSNKRIWTVHNPSSRFTCGLSSTSVPPSPCGSIRWKQRET
ncbi:hypothetical protein PMAYCL1PPCAC_24910, partial [Pristionchus mayeri]